MANVLDLGLLEYFAVIFPALLVFAIVFALLEKLKILGESKTIHAVVSIAVAFIILLSKDVIQIINFIAPWFVLLFIFIVLLLMVYKIFGATDENLKNFITGNTMTQWAIIIVGVVIIIAGISNVFGQRLVPITKDGSNVTTTISSGEGVEGRTFGETVGKTIFHPKVVGLIFIFLVAAFAVGLLSQKVV